MTQDEPWEASAEMHPANPEIARTAHQADRNGNCGICRTRIDVGHWEEPFPLESAPLPAFPVDLLGESLARFVTAAATSLQTAPDLIAFSVLGTLSVATGGQVRVHIKPQWTESTALWLAAFADSSERKTPALDIAAAPLRAVEADLVEEARPHVEADAQEIRITTAAMKRAEDAAAAPTNRAITPKQLADAEGAREAAKRDAAEARDRLTELGDGRSLPRLLVRDITLEALGKVMTSQGGRIGSLASEGGLLKVAAGLYSSNGQANTDLMLEAYSGGPYTIDRVGRPGSHLERTFLALALIVQPGIMAGLEKRNPEFRQNGLLGRFLYGRPAPVETDTFASPAMPTDLEEAYAKSITTMVQRVWSSHDAIVLELDAGARDLFAAFYDEFGMRRKTGGDLFEIADWAGKLRGQLVRIAACLTLYDNPEARTITRARIADAIGMSPYFIRHAKAVFDLMGRDAEGKRKPLRDIVAWLAARRKPCAPFSQNEVWQALKGRTWAESADDVKNALNELEDDGWISLLPSEDEPGKRGRKPSPRYEVHPWISDASRKSRNGLPGAHRRSTEGH